MSLGCPSINHTQTIPMDPYAQSFPMHLAQYPYQMQYPQPFVVSSVQSPPSENECQILQEMNKINSNLQSLFDELQKDNVGHELQTKTDENKVRCENENIELRKQCKLNFQENKELKQINGEIEKRANELEKDINKYFQSKENFDVMVTELTNQAEKFKCERDEYIQKNKKAETEIKLLRQTLQGNENTVAELKKKLNQLHNRRSAQPKKQRSNTGENKKGPDTFYRDVFTSMELSTVADDNSMMLKLCATLQKSGPCDYKEIHQLVHQWQVTQRHEKEAKNVLSSMVFPPDDLIYNICEILQTNGMCSYNDIVPLLRVRMENYSQTEFITNSTRVLVEGQMVWASLGEINRKNNLHSSNLTLQYYFPASENSVLRKDSELQMALICNDFLSRDSKPKEKPDDDDFCHNHNICQRWGRLASKMLGRNCEHTPENWKDQFVSFVQNILLPNIGDDWVCLTETTTALTKQLLFATKLRDMASKNTARANFRTILESAAQSLQVQPDHFENEVDELVVLCERTKQSPMACSESTSDVSAAMAAVRMMMNTFCTNTQRILSCQKIQSVKTLAFPFELEVNHMKTGMVRECKELGQCTDFGPFQKKWLTKIDHSSIRHLSDTISSSRKPQSQHVELMQKIEFIHKSQRNFFELSTPYLDNFYIQRMMRHTVQRTHFCSASALPGSIVIPYWTKICLSQAEEFSRSRDKSGNTT